LRFFTSGIYTFVFREAWWLLHGQHLSTRLESNPFSAVENAPNGQFPSTQGASKPCSIRRQLWQPGLRETQSPSATTQSIWISVSVEGDLKRRGQGAVSVDLNQQKFRLTPGYLHLCPAKKMGKLGMDVCSLMPQNILASAPGSAINNSFD